MDALVLLGSLCILIAIGVPVAYALGMSALIGAFWIDLPLDAIIIQIASGVNKFSLLAIPFFVLAGAIMAEGGMAHRLVAFAAVFVGFIRGGLSLVNILASTFFGAISGSSVADTASVGTVLIPEMEKKGYPRAFATAVTVAGSVQAILIPPSHNAVIYSLAAGGSVSIASLFLAGVVPGVVAATPVDEARLEIVLLDDVRVGAVVVLVSAFLVAAVSAGVGGIARVLDQQGQLTLLRLAGAPVGALAAARRREVVAPLALCGGGAGLLGVALGALTIGGAIGVAADGRWLVLFAGLAAAGVAAVLGADLLSRPVLVRATADLSERE